MPELPEVETLASQLREELHDRTIQTVEIRNDSIVTTPRESLLRQIPGRTILRVGRRGKFIRLDLSGALTLWLHLGMTGQLLLFNPSSLKAEEPHVHFKVSFRESPQFLLYRDVRRFGRIALTEGGDLALPERIRRLGREPGEWDGEEFASFLKTRRARIKSLLLDQRVVAGLGNIYTDESLHRAGIHPLRRADRIGRKRLLRLHRAMGEVLREAIHWGGSSIDDYRHLDGGKGEFQRFHRVYSRREERCLQCRALIRQVKISGRTSWFCPKCQR